MDSQTMQFLAALHEGGTAAYWWHEHATYGFSLRDGYPTVPQNDAYFCVNPVARVMERSERGGEVAVERLNVLHADFDGKSFVAVNETTDLETIIAEVRLNVKRPNEKVIRRMAEERYRARMFKILSKIYLRKLADRLSAAPAPSFVIFSGGGAHVYWLLKEPILLIDDLAREQARSILRAWTRMVGADLGAATLDRVLRVPGTYNTKYDPAALVQFRTFAPERRYSPQDVADLIMPFLQKEAEETRQQQRQAAKPARSVNPDKPGYIVRNGREVWEFIREFDRRNSPVPILERNGYRLAKHSSTRMVRPGGTRDSISILTAADGRTITFHHSSDDPLGAVWFDDHPHGAFSALVELEYGGDFAACLADQLPPEAKPNMEDPAERRRYMNLLQSVVNRTPTIQSTAQVPYTITHEEIFG